jgi:hypothetical protein
MRPHSGRASRWLSGRYTARPPTQSQRSCAVPLLSWPLVLTSKEKSKTLLFEHHSNRHYGKSKHCISILHKSFNNTFTARCSNFCNVSSTGKIRNIHNIVMKLGIGYFHSLKRINLNACNLSYQHLTIDH